MLIDGGFFEVEVGECLVGRGGGSGSCLEWAGRIGRGIGRWRLEAYIVGEVSEMGFG